MRPLGATDPTTIATYRLMGVLGGGGMGRVYLGQSPSGRSVAIKVIRADLAEDAQFRERFAREVAAVRTVNPLFTAAVVDADTDADIPWLASVFIDGPSLEQHVEAHGPLSPGAVLTLAAGLAEALSSIHRVGLVHRDLKPSNVLLDDTGPHIIDFGIALASDSPRITTSLVVGTPSYIAPERIHSSEVGPAGDIFSLGATLVFATTGKNLVNDGNMYSQIVQITMGNFDLSLVPKDLRPIVVRCTSHQKNDRPTAEELTHILVAAGVQAPTPGWYGPRHRSPRQALPIVTLPPPSAPRASRRRVLALGGVVGLAVASGGVVVAGALLSKKSGDRGAATRTPTSAVPGARRLMWIAQLGSLPLVPTRSDATDIPFLANRDGRIISRTASEVFARDRFGHPLWTRPLSDRLIDLRTWGNSLIAADPDQVWRLDADTGDILFTRAVVENEKTTERGDNPDGLPVEVHRLALSTDYAYVSLGTALISLDRSCAPGWRTPRPPAQDGHRPAVGSPYAANGEWLVTHTISETTAQVDLYDASNGAPQWQESYQVASEAQAVGGPGGQGGPGGRPGGPSNNLWSRSDVRIAGDYVVLRDGAKLSVRRISDGSVVWGATSPFPVAAIEVFGDLLLVCANQLTALSISTGIEAWQLPLRGTQIGVYAEGRSLIVASDQFVVAVDSGGQPIWQTELPDQVAQGNPTSVTINEQAAFIIFAPGQNSPDQQGSTMVAYALDTIN